MSRLSGSGIVKTTRHIRIHRPLRALIPVLIVLALILPPGSEASGPGDTGKTRPLLPDLRTLQPNGLRLVQDRDNSRAFLRFNNSIINIGPGPLELFGRDIETVDHGADLPEGHEPGPHQHISVYQRIFGTNGQVLIEPFVGEFIHHTQHSHWHLEEFSRYEVWKVRPGGFLYDLVSANAKVSYCVTDLRPAGSSLGFETWPRAGYLSCSGTLQGLTQGWVDTYVSGLARQWVEVTGVQDGSYALRSVVDPNDRILEADETNNAAVTYFQLVDGQLQWEPVRDVLQDKVREPTIPYEAP